MLRVEQGRSLYRAIPTVTFAWYTEFVVHPIYSPFATNKLILMRDLKIIGDR